MENEAAHLETSEKEETAKKKDKTAESNETNEKPSKRVSKWKPERQNAESEKVLTNNAKE